MERLSNTQKLCLIYWHRVFEARDRLKFHDDIAALFNKDGYKLLSKLAQTAFADDPRMLALMMDRVTRR